MESITEATSSVYEERATPSEPAAARKELICIVFPGIVRNHERAIECLGGIREVSRVYSMPTSKRLGLSFSPENPFAKKTFGDLVAAPGLLLRVRVRRRKADGACELLGTTVVGQVNKAYKFDSMFDFSVLPTTLSAATSQPECVLHQLMPTGLDNVDWIKGPAPHFIVPAHLTRSDKPLDYRYSDKKHGVTKKLENPDEDVHNKLRPERMTHYTHVVFSLVEELPTEPNPRSIEALNVRIQATPSLRQEVDIVKKYKSAQALEERPIWSKNSLQLHKKISHQSLKIILPTLGFYYRGGPWRHLWVRFGYDPRRNPEARLYQTLDFRMRNVAGSSAYIIQRTPYVHKKVARVRYTKLNPLLSEQPADDLVESAVVFREGIVPSQKQIYYQYCDVHCAEVERLLSTRETAPGALCHARRGWLPAGVDDRIRELILESTRRTIAARAREPNTTQINEVSSSSGEEGPGEGDGEGEWGASEEFILPEVME